MGVAAERLGGERPLTGCAGDGRTAVYLPEQQNYEADRVRLGDEGLGGDGRLAFPI